MARRIFICAERFFPRGDAGANRVLFIAKAMKIAGWEPVILSIGKMEDRYFNQIKKAYYYDGIEFENIVCRMNGVMQKVERALLNGRKTIGLLKKHNLCKHDRVLIYSSTSGYVSALINYTYVQIGAAVVMDVVEWHQPFQFRFGNFDPRYISYRKCFDKLFVDTGNVITISKYLEQHFQRKGCNVLKIPIYVEISEKYTYQSASDGRLNLIYPGNPYRKDSLKIMLEGIAGLTDEERKRICFHLTGANRSLLEKSIPGKEFLLGMPCVSIHSWMEYSDLVTLYEMIDFALIARPDNVVTKANYPSKVPELMNKGIPVIINNVGDVCEYLKDGKNAIIIETSEPKSCTSALRRCLALSKQEIIEMHQVAYETAKSRFDYQLCSKALDDYFLSMK